MEVKQSVYRSSVNKRESSDISKKMAQHQGHGLIVLLLPLQFSLHYVTKYWNEVAYRESLVENCCRLHQRDTNSRTIPEGHLLLQECGSDCVFVFAFFTPTLFAIFPNSLALLVVQLSRQTTFSPASHSPAVADDILSYILPVMLTPLLPPKACDSAVLSPLWLIFKYDHGSRFTGHKVSLFTTMIYQTDNVNVRCQQDNAWTIPMARPIIQFPPTRAMFIRRLHTDQHFLPHSAVSMGSTLVDTAGRAEHVNMHSAGEGCLFCPRAPIQTWIDKQYQRQSSRLYVHFVAACCNRENRFSFAAGSPSDHLLCWPFHFSFSVNPMQTLIPTNSLLSRFSKEIS